MERSVGLVKTMALAMCMSVIAVMLVGGIAEAQDSNDQGQWVPIDGATDSIGVFFLLNPNTGEIRVYGKGGWTEVRRVERHQDCD